MKVKISPSLSLYPTKIINQPKPGGSEPGSGSPSLFNIRLSNNTNRKRKRKKRNQYHRES
jgi:hypothetical protein